MHFTHAWQVSLLLLLGLSLLPDTGAITEAEKETILDGIDAGKTITNALELYQFEYMLTTFGNNISPWIEGIGMFGKLLGKFLPEEDEILEEMKKGFEEINLKLDDLRDKTDTVKKAIDWTVVKIDFDSIETNIWILDEKLNEVHQASDPSHEKEEYIKLYDSHYDEAGMKLFNAIAYNDEDFTLNILKAGMEYTEYYRSTNQEYMRGLIALLMQASHIEISYEKFTEHDRGDEAIWKMRLESSRGTMADTDDILENAWSDLFADEIDELARSCAACSHVYFRDMTYEFLSTKYYWRYWFVISYDDVTSNHLHTIRLYTDYGHYRWRYYGRNFVVSTSDSSRHFDRDTALSYLIDRECTAVLDKCKEDAAYELILEAPFYGHLVVALSQYVGWASIGPRIRQAYDKDIVFYKGTWSEKFSMIYFG